MSEATKRYYSRLRDGLLPIGERERQAAQAIADGARTVRDVERIVDDRALTATHQAILNLRGKGIVLPPPGVNHDGALAIAPGYVVHKGDIFELRKVPHDPVL